MHHCYDNGMKLKMFSDKNEKMVAPQECHMMIDGKADAQPVKVSGKRQVDAGRVVQSRLTPAMKRIPAGARSEPRLK